MKVKPEVAKNFYVLLDKLVKEEISSYTLKKKSQVQDNNKRIKNLITIRPKGKIYLNYLNLFLLFIYLSIFLF